MWTGGEAAKGKGVERNGPFPHPHSEQNLLNQLLPLPLSFSYYSGTLVLQSPLGGDLKHWPKQLEFEPETGALVMHPSSLSHWVTPYAGERPRVSLAFNIKVVTDVPAAQKDGRTLCVNCHFGVVV